MAGEVPIERQSKEAKRQNWMFAQIRLLRKRDKAMKETKLAEEEAAAKKVTVPMLDEALTEVKLKFERFELMFDEKMRDNDKEIVAMQTLLDGEIRSRTRCDGPAAVAAIRNAVDNLEGKLFERLDRKNQEAIGHWCRLFGHTLNSRFEHWIRSLSQQVLEVPHDDDDEHAGLEPWMIAEIEAEEREEARI